MKKKIALLLLSSFMIFQSVTVFGESLRPDASAFPNRTIIIGTYAIVIDQMTSAILEKAEESAQMENQGNIYYKSDINAGTWYDITQSSDISEISKTVDNVVSYQHINSLNLTHYTNAEGETIDLTTGNITNTSDIGDIAYPANMPELKGIEEELRIQQALKEQGNKEGTQCYNSLQKILNSLYSDDDNTFIQQLQNSIKQLDAMEQYIIDLRAEGAPLEYINEATNQKTILENRKKLLCYQKVLERLENEMTLLDYNTNDALISKYTEYITNIQTTLPTLEETKASETSSQLQKMLLEAEHSFQEAAGAGIKKSTDTGLETILAIKAAMRGEEVKTESQKQKQKSVLNEAKQKAEQNIKELSQNGCKGEEYKKAEQYGENEAVLQQKQTEGLLSLNVALDDVSICIEQLSNLLSEEEMIALYDESIQNIENALHSLNENDTISEQIKKVLEESKNNFQNKKNVLQLNSMESYQTAKEQKEQFQKQAEQKQQLYLSAAEEGKTELLESTKEEMNEAIEQMQQAEQKMSEIEQQLQKSDGASYNTEQGSENTNQATNANNDNQQSQQTNQSEQNKPTENESQQTSQSEQNKPTENESQQTSQSEQNKPIENESQQTSQSEQNKATENESQQTSQSEQNKPVENESQQTSESEQNKATENESQQTSQSEQNKAIENESQQEGQTNQNIQINRENNYTEQEKQDLLAVIKELEENEQQTFLMPYYIIFQDYNVKLLSPIWDTGQEIYVPAQELVRQLGAKVYKSKIDGNYVFKDNGVLIQYWLGQETIYVNGEEMNISPPPTVHHNRVYLPLSVFEKAYGMEHMKQQEYIIVYKV